MRQQQRTITSFIAVFSLVCGARAALPQTHAILGLVDFSQGGTLPESGGSVTVRVEPTEFGAGGLPARTEKLSIAEARGLLRETGALGVVGITVGPGRITQTTVTLLALEQA